MSRRLARSRVVTASDGSVFVNVRELGCRSPRAVLRAALAQAGDAFIGVQLTTEEARAVARRLDNAEAEAVAFVFGARLRRRRN